MSFPNIIGQNRAKEILTQALMKDRVAHAYLFHGLDGVGKEALAIEFAQALMCKSAETRPCQSCSACRRVANFNHPDFLFIFPALKSAGVEMEREILDSAAENPYARKKPWASPAISIERIRELRRITRVKPFEGRRIVIIAEAEKMTIEASNALLKILEEPPEHMHLILTTSRVNMLLPTIISRCQEIRFRLLTDEEIEDALVQRKQLSAQQAQLLARMSQGSYSRALEWLEESIFEYRDVVIELLRCCLKDLISQLQFVEELLKKYDRKTIKDILLLIQIWFRDAMVYSCIAGKKNNLNSRIVNVDKLDTLGKFVDAFDEIDYRAALGEVERALELLDRNIQINLIFIVIMVRMQSILKRKGRI
jgi:DNA polymerase III subunit delta'